MRIAQARTYEKCKEYARLDTIYVNWVAAKVVMNTKEIDISVAPLSDCKLSALQSSALAYRTTA